MDEVFSMEQQHYHQQQQYQSDYERFICENIECLYKDSLLSSSKARNYLLPDDDIEIIDIPKRFETIELSKPELEAEIDLHVNECLRSYNSNYLYLSKNYEKHNIANLILKKKSDIKKIIANTEYQEYECDINDSETFKLNNKNINFNSIDPDSLIKTILDSNKSTIQEENLVSKSSFQRLKQLFNYYPLKDDSKTTNHHHNHQDDDLIEYRHEFEVPNELNTKTNYLLCKCIQLKFELDCEPIFAHMALYDLKLKKKISENFYFDLNSEQIKYMLRLHQQNTNQQIDASTLSHTCLFNITYVNKDIYLVIRLEKVLQQGDINECVEPYIKYQQLQSYNEKQNFKEKVHLNSIQFCERLGRFKMPFAWTAINLMSILNVNTNEINSNGVGLSGGGDEVLYSNNNNNTVLNSKSSSLDRKLNETNLNQMKNYSIRDDNQLINTKTHSINTNTNDLKFLEQHLKSFKPISICINSFFKQDADKLSDNDLYKYLNELRKQPTSSLIKKLKCINGVLKMEFSPFNKQQQIITNNSNNNNNNSTYSPVLLNMNNYFFVNSSLQRLKYNRVDNNPLNSGVNGTGSSNVNNVHIIKDLLEFPSKEVYIPNYTYRNLLFIYPLEVNLNNRVSTTSTANANPTTLNQPNGNIAPVISSSSLNANLNTLNNCSARNIAIKINFMKGEDDYCALPLIYGRSSTREFCKEIYSTVLYHNRTPQYYDEIKIKLPAILTDSNYHLLFTFSHVSCSTGAAGNGGSSGGAGLSNNDNNSANMNIQSIETIIGYSWLPLLQPNDKQRILNNGIYTLPIIFTDKLKPGYSQQSPFLLINEQQQQHQLTINDSINYKSYFELRFNLQSTIHTQDIYLDKFINLSNNILMNDYIYLNEQQQQHRNNNYDKIELLLKQSLTNLHLANQEAIVKFLFILLDKLFNIMMIFNVNISQLCLEAISRICFKITNLLVNDNDIHMRNKYLVQYVKYACNLPYKTIIQSINNANNQRLFHEELVLQLIKALNNTPIISTATTTASNSSSSSSPSKLSTNSDTAVDQTFIQQQQQQHQQQLNELILQNLWFYLEILFKSMCFYVLIINPTSNDSSTITFNNKTKSPTHQQSPSSSLSNSFSNKYHKKFSKFYLDNLNYLIKLLIKEILYKNFNNLNRNYKLTIKLNQNLAFLLSDLCSIIDRMYIFQVIGYYLKEINTRIKKLVVSSQQQQQQSHNRNSNSSISGLNYDLKHLYAIKLDFLRIIYSNEHFIALNTPLNVPLNIQRVSHLMVSQPTQQIPSSSYLDSSSKAALLLTQSSYFFDQPVLFNQHYLPQQQQQQSVATTGINLKLGGYYFKRYYLIGLLLQNFYTIFSKRVVYETNNSMFTPIQVKLINLLRNLFESHDYDERYHDKQLMRNKIASLYMPFLLVIINYMPNLYEKKYNSTSSSNQTTLVDDTNIKNTLICALWLLKNIERTQLLKLIKYLNYDKINKLLQMLDLCLIYFEYRNSMNQTTSSNVANSIGGGASAASTGVGASINNNNLIEELNKKFNRLNIKLKLEDLMFGTQNARCELLKRNRIRDENVIDYEFDMNNEEDGDTCQQQQQQIDSQHDVNDYDNDIDNYVLDIDEYFNDIDEDNVNSLDDNNENENDVLITPSSCDVNDEQQVVQELSEQSVVMMKDNGNLSMISNLNALTATSASNSMSVMTLNQSSSLQKQPTLRWRKDQTKFRLFNSTSSTSSTSSTCSNATSNTSNSGGSMGSLNTRFNQASIPIESYLNLKSNLATECTLIALDTIECLIKYIQEVKQLNTTTTIIQPSSSSSPLTSTSSPSSTISLSNDILIIKNNYFSIIINIFKLILNSLNLNQSINSLKCLFSYQRMIISKYPELLFDNLISTNTTTHQQTSNCSTVTSTSYKIVNDLCADLCQCLFKYCISSSKHIRSEASASLYALLKQNYDLCNNFLRIKMHIIITFSNLITYLCNNTANLNTLLINEYNLKRSLRTIYFYNDYDVNDTNCSFQIQLKELILNLNCILCNTIKMKLTQTYCELDNEMLIDLMYRLANCYLNSNSNLRLIWLQSMAQKHLCIGNLVEAGQCLIHAAALIAEYLSIYENKPFLPIGCTSFKQATINALEESAISDDILILSSYYNQAYDYIQQYQQQQQQQQPTLPQSSSIQLQSTNKYFTESGLISLIEQAAIFLIHSQHFEVANQLYKLLIPIYEESRDYKKLAQVHSKLNDCFNKIMIHGSKRLFGTYFRVGFYGKQFEDLDGEEFIYKEPGITKLSEIANRLETFYNEKFTPDSIEIMKDSNNVDRRVLQENKAYIQITYVEPYFDRWELIKYTTHFERNYSLKRFIYSTPFTLDGKAHGTLKEQYKRKTILTTERAFPYIKTRIVVIDKQQVVLSPVEVAIEDLQKKIDELKQAIMQEPADPKILQMVLQGCVGTTVNQGPLEMALAFLQPNLTEPFTEHHNKLRLCFKEFTRRCSEALEKNKTLIGSDQIEYQQEMERNNKELKARIEPMIEARPFTFS